MSFLIVSGFELGQYQLVHIEINSLMTESAADLSMYIPTSTYVDAICQINMLHAVKVTCFVRVAKLCVILWEYSHPFS